MARRLEFETAVTQLQITAGLTTRSRQTTTRNRIREILKLATSLRAHYRDVSVELQIVEALNAVNIVIRQAIDNDVVYQLLMLYLVSTDSKWQSTTH